MTDVDFSCNQHNGKYQAYCRPRTPYTFVLEVKVQYNMIMGDIHVAELYHGLHVHNNASTYLASAITQTHSELLVLE